MNKTLLDFPTYNLVWKLYGNGFEIREKKKWENWLGGAFIIMRVWAKWSVQSKQRGESIWKGLAKPNQSPLSTYHLQDRDFVWS